MREIAAMTESHKPSPNSAPELKSDNPSSGVGRTQWDALVDVVRLLGNGAPYFVILVGVAFSYYKFQELSQQNSNDLRRAQSEATKNYEQQLSSANKALIDTYAAMGTISATQIKATTRTQEMQNSREELKKQVDERTAALRQAKIELDAGVSLKSQVQQELKGLQEGLARDRTELQSLEQLLASRKRDLADSAQEVNTLRNRVVDLAQAVRGKKANAGELAMQLLKDYDVSVESLLAPDGQGLKSLLGRRDADMISALQNDNRFLLIARLPAQARNDNVQYLAAKSFSNNIFKDLAYIGSDGSNVVSAETMSILLGVKLNDNNDWSLTYPIIILSKSKESYSYYYPRYSAEVNEWDVLDLTRDSARQPGLIIKPSAAKPRYLTPSELETLAPDIAEQLESVSQGVRPGINYRMYKRSKTFNAAATFDEKLSQLPADLRETVIQLLNAAVKHRMSEALTYMSGGSPPQMAGRVAAIALRPAFRFVSYKTEGPESWSLFSVSNAEKSDRGTRSATPENMVFRFTRSQGGGWLLESVNPSSEPS
jgi:hypothetical protein